jgi:CRISPR/Cas system CSM-associated protein Csm3 (group 7 of RAMP superfamily)
MGDRVAVTARGVREVTFVRCVLRFDEPGGVTLPRLPERDEPAAVLDTDPWGRPHLPGTSLAGAIRQRAWERLGKDAADTLFGRLLERGTGGEVVDAEASKVWVLGSSLLDDSVGENGANGAQVLASTAIDRRRAAAASATLRREEVLPAGSRFEVFLRCDDVPEDLLAQFLQSLVGWRPLLGRGASRGRGACSIEEVRQGRLRLDQRADLRQWLTMSGPALVRAVAASLVAASTAEASPSPLVSVPMRVVGPFRIGSGRQSAGPDGNEVQLMFTDAAGRRIVPGTSVKGVLRSRVEHILRSVGVTPPPCLDQRCGQCWTCQVFGFGGGQDATSLSVGARGRVRVTDAVIVDAVSVRRQHVAIDRFTGGALPGALYTVEALEGGRFNVELWDLGLAEPEAVRLLALLRLVLDDLNDGIIGIGGGVARGYGWVAADVDRAVARGELPTRAAAQSVVAQMAAATVGSAR